MVHFVCVGTPQRQGENAADTRYVDGAVTGLLPFLRPGDLVVGKSTVPVGTAARLAEQVCSGPCPGAIAGLEPGVPARGATRSRTPGRPDRLVYGLPAEAAEAEATGPARRRSTPRRWPPGRRD